MIYLRAGLYAEGPTDYQFLRPLLDRLMDELAASSYAGQYELGECLAIDAPAGSSYANRADRIAAAVQAHREECTLVVIHSDGAGDPERARREQVTPGIDAARVRCVDRPVALAACIPVREIEAWMLVDPDVFPLLGSSTPPAYPADPERESDPKATLDRLLADSGVRRRRHRPRDRDYALFGENVQLACLRRLPAFVRFETELASAIAEVAGRQGVRPPEG
jgi:hypothetical protein